MKSNLNRQERKAREEDFLVRNECELPSRRTALFLVSCPWRSWRPGRFNCSRQWYEVARYKLIRWHILKPFSFYAELFIFTRPIFCIGADREFDGLKSLPFALFCQAVLGVRKPLRRVSESRLSFTDILLDLAVRRKTTMHRQWVVFDVDE